MSKDMTEVELAAKFKVFLSGMDVYPEVEVHEGFIDLVAIDRNKVVIAVEVKKTFNFKLLEQGIRSKKYANYVYVAIPDTRDLHFRIKLCRDYGIGILVLRKDGRINELLKPSFNSKIKPLFLSEHQKQSVAGSQHDRITSFGITNLNITNFLKVHGGQYNARLLLENIQHHYSNTNTALSSIKAWIKKGIIKEFEFKDKKFILKK